MPLIRDTHRIMTANQQAQGAETLPCRHENRAGAARYWQITREHWMDKKENPPGHP